MKSFRQIISEVAQPNAEDELNFKQKHVIDHILDPNAEEDQFTADHIQKFKNRADYADGEDHDVYEDVTLARRAIPGQEGDDVDGDGDDDTTDDQLRYRRHAQIKNKIIDEASMTSAQIKKREEIVMGMKKNAADLKKKYGKDWESTMYAIATKQAMSEETQLSNVDWEKDSAKVKKSSDPKFVSKMIEKWGSRGGAWLNHPAFTKEVTEALDPVGKEDADVNNDGKVNSSDAFLKARRKAIAKKLQQEGLTDVVQPAGGDFDSEASHVAYKKKNLKGSDYKGEPLNVAEANAECEMPVAKTQTGGVSQVKPKAGLRVFAGKTKQTDVVETFSPGDIKLTDGSYVNVLDEEARLLNSLYESLDEANQNKMMKIVESSVAGFESIVQFAEDNI